MKSFQAVNLTVAFLLELMVLAAYACVSVTVPGSALLRYGMAALSTSIVIALWALFAAPLAQRRLATPGLYYFKMLVFAGAAAILLGAHWIHLAIYFAATAVLSLSLEVSQSNR